MRRRSTQIVSIVLVLVLVLAAAGCGKKKSDTSTTTTTTTEAAATTTTSGDETTTTSSTTTAATGLGALAANCKQLAGLSQEFSAAFSGANGDVKKEAAVLKAFADKTPEDIRPDFETLADAFAQISGALKGVDLSGGQTPDAATLAKLLKLSQKFQDPKFTAAMNNIETWATKNCHA